MPSTAMTAEPAISSCRRRARRARAGRRRRRCRRRAGRARAAASAGSAAGRPDARRGRPRRPAGRRCRPGTTAARKRAQQAEPRDGRRRATGSRRTARDQVSEQCCTTGSRAQPTPMPRTTPEHRGRRRRGPAPPARITRRDCFGVPPLAAISARVRDCRRAPTANAGPGQQHHLEQRHHHDQHDDRDRRVVGRGLPLRDAGAGARSPAAGPRSPRATARWRRSG